MCFACLPLLLEDSLILSDKRALAACPLHFVFQNPPAEAWVELNFVIKPREHTLSSIHAFVFHTYINTACDFPPESPAIPNNPNPH